MSLFVDPLLLAMRTIVALPLFDGSGVAIALTAGLQRTAIGAYLRFGAISSLVLSTGSYTLSSWRSRGDSASCSWSRSAAGMRPPSEERARVAVSWAKPAKAST